MARYPKGSKNNKIAPKKRKYTKRSTNAKSMIQETSAKKMYEIKDGIPSINRVRQHSEEWYMMKNTLQSLRPKKQHAVVDKKYRNRMVAMARREFPEMKVRSTLSGDKRNALIWREK